MISRMYTPESRQIGTFNCPQFVRFRHKNAQEETSLHNGSNTVLFLEIQTLREASVTQGMKRDDYVVV